jgi:hypothetical protein
MRPLHLLSQFSNSSPQTGPGDVPVDDLAQAITRPVHLVVPPEIGLQTLPCTVLGGWEKTRSQWNALPPNLALMTESEKTPLGPEQASPVT